MARNKAMLSPDKDAGWGLIYRLNNLWAQVDPKATGGDYDGWNFVLDRIYCNLLYEDNMIINKIYKCAAGHEISTISQIKECPKCREENKIIVKIKLIGIKSLKLSEEDELVYKFLTEKIAEEKNNKIKAIKYGKKSDKKYEGKSLEQSKADYYRALMMKDIWLRKFMQSKGLYLKVIEHDPSSALFGS